MQLNLRLRELENFVALAEHQSVTRAAKAIGLSQPAMSTALKGLESALNATLFVRHRGQGVSLTPEGELLLVESRALLARARDLQLRMSDVVSSSSGLVVLASLVTVAPIVSPKLVRRFQESHPGIEVVMRTGSHDQVLQWVQSGEVHAAITYDLELARGVRFNRICNAEPHALLPLDHRLAHRSSIRLAELTTDPYILLDLPLSREYFTSLFLSSDVLCQPASRHNDLSLVRSLVGNGFGYSLVNLLPATDLAQDGTQVVHIPLRVPIRPLGLGLATRSDEKPTRSVELFIAFASEHLALPRRSRGIVG